MAMVSVTIRMDEEAKVMWRELADKEGRSLGGYLERVLTWMKDRELLMEASALDVIADRLVMISNRLEEMTLQNNKKMSKKKSSESVKKLSAYDMEFDDFLSESYWRKWIDHLHQSEVHLNHYQGKMQYERLREIDASGLDCEMLIDELIKNTAKSIYVPFEWQRNLERELSK